MKGLGAIIVVAAISVAGGAHADKVTDTMEKAAKAYGSGKLSTMVRQLQSALARVRKVLAKAYADAMPPAPDGWRAQRARNSGQMIGVMGGGVTVSRRYRPSSGSGSATAQLIVDSPLLATMGAIYANPAMAQNAGYEQFDIDGLNQPAFYKFDEDRKRGEVVILIGGRVFMKVNVRRVESEDVLKGLAKGWNIKKIKEIAELP